MTVFAGPLPALPPVVSPELPPTVLLPPHPTSGTSATRAMQGRARLTGRSFGRSHVLQQIAEAIAGEVRGRREHEDRGGGRERDPGEREERVEALGRHAAELGGGGRR